MSRPSTLAAVLIVAVGAVACGGPSGTVMPGAHLWTEQFGTAGFDTVTAAATGPFGLVVVGSTTGDLEGTLEGPSDVFVRAFDADAQVLWTRQVGSSESESAHGVGVDAAGVITVVGHTWGELFGPNQAGRDAFVWRLTAVGSDVSTEQFGPGGLDVASAVAVAPSGAFVVVGATSGVLDDVNAGGRDAYVRWYDDDGVLVRTRQFGTPMTDSASAVALDGAGNAYVLGSTEGALDGPHTGEIDVFLRAFDTDGDVVWGRQFGTATFDSANGIVADAGGTVYLVGSTWGSLDGPLTGTADAFVRSYDAVGALRWALQFGATPATGGAGIAIDAWQNVLVAGTTSGVLEGANIGGADAFVRKFDADGNVRWTRQFGTGSDDIAEAVATAADGTIYAVGMTEGALGAPHAGAWDVFVRAFTP